MVVAVARDEDESVDVTAAVCAPEVVSADAGVDTDTDRFVFKNISDSIKGSKKDLIYNFDSGEDLIDLSFIDADTSTNGNQDFDFTNNKATANSVWLKDAGKHLLVRADVTGDTVHDFEIQIASIDDIYVDDFIL